jgi:hypothetical protein
LRWASRNAFAPVGMPPTRMATFSGKSGRWAYGRSSRRAQATPRASARFR